MQEFVQRTRAQGGLLWDTVKQKQAWQPCPDSLSTTLALTQAWLPRPVSLSLTLTLTLHR